MDLTMEERSLQFQLRQDIWQIILTLNDNRNHFRYGNGWLLKAARCVSTFLHYSTRSTKEVVGSRNGVSLANCYFG
jgi:hypothetical protein